ncbi:PRC-barrel domain-containing protein [Alkalihalobacillus hwajinpoensis]|uniref:PRC-barrel domain-containing protein n=1 Tax=Guptibacillus hwajinpoensis TaxID=208199 RepID=UPI001883AB93|nr:PRC-barrel domain-containing protein [Pseudalkalibacillus hwajinpoensis]MBF0706873.1 PRC-barrel domain-containing protein [Pseudalkalibacillus hwajinpoensis]
MLVSESEVNKYTIDTKDGQKGVLKELYFDDEHWTIRYLVVDTHKWLPGRKVLISPISIEQLNHENEAISVSLTSEEVSESPDIDTDQPISRKHEMELNRHFSWPYYWVGTNAWGNGMYPRPFMADDLPDADSTLHHSKQDEENHLRSTNEVAGYHIQATDGEIGHVKDFIFDEESWQLRYIIVDTKNWFSGKEVLLSTKWIHDIHWQDRSVVVNIKKEEVRQSPEFRLNEPITRRFEEDLHTHYGKTGYWKF